MTEQQYKKFTDVCSKINENLPTLKQYKLIVLTDIDGTRVLMRSRRKKNVKGIYHCLLYHLKELEKEGKRLNFDGEIKISVIGKKDAQGQVSRKKAFNKHNGNRQGGGRRPFPNQNGNGQPSHQKRVVIKKREAGK